MLLYTTKLFWSKSIVYFYCYTILLLCVGVYGSAPQLVVDDEEDFLRHTHSVNYDLVQHVSIIVQHVSDHW